MEKFTMNKSNVSLSAPTTPNTDAVTVALRKALKGLDYALTYNRRFETVVEGLLPPVEERIVVYPRVAHRAWVDLPAEQKRGFVESRRERLRTLVAEHRMLAIAEHKIAKERARKKAQKLRRKIISSAMKETKDYHMMSPREVPGDGLFPGIVVDEGMLTYGEVAAMPTPAFGALPKTPHTPRAHCGCKPCVADAKRRAFNKERQEALARLREKLRQAAKNDRRRRNYLKRCRRHCNGRVTPEMYRVAVLMFPWLREDEDEVEEEPPVEEAVEATESGFVIPEIVITPPPPRRLSQDERDRRAFEEAERYNRRFLKVYNETTEPIRDPGLVKRLRERVLMIRYAAKAQVAAVCQAAQGVVSKLWAEPAEEAVELQPLPQMRVEMADESPGGGEASQASNVVLQEAGPVEETVIGGSLGNLRKYCSTAETTVSENTDRWYPIDNFVWSKTQQPDTELAAYRLPFEAVYKKPKTGEVLTMKSNVLTNEFRVRQYAMMDMVVRLQVNATPFHIGQALVAWFYQLDEDRFGKYRRNNVVMSQAHHVLMDVAASNTVELYIPYRNFRTYMNVYPHTELAPPLYLGSLIINVLNTLNAPDCSSPEIFVNVSVRFVNCQLMGMIPPSIASRTEVKAEMFSTIMAIEAAKYVRQFLADRNRDQPPSPHQPPYLTPTATGSICTGTNDVEPVIPMRLDAIGQTPHPEYQDAEFTVQGIASKFCYLFTKKVLSTDKQYTRVVCLEAGPIFDLKEYQKVVIDGTDCYYLPPIAVLSQLYALWRGDIEFRIDIVSTRYHQLRLWICWVPGYTGDLTYEEAKSCAGTLFDLSDDNRSTIVTVPFISDKPWWGHKYSNGVDVDKVRSPSKFCVYIVNPLQYSCNVTKEIEMNIYIRAGKNFELAVPCQPTIGLGFHAAFQGKSDDYTTAYPGYFPWYAGVWRNLVGSKAGILRYGPGSDHIAQFVNLKPHSFYKFKDTKIARTMKFKTTLSDPWVFGDQLVFVPVDVGDGYGFRYLGVMLNRPNVAEDISKLRDYFCELDKNGVWKYRVKPDYDYIALAGDTSENTYYDSTTNQALLETEYQLPTAVGRRSLSDASSYGDLESETPMDNKIGAIKFEISPASDASMVTFGESHMDLKDLCRRYQLYHQLNIARPTPSLAEVDYTFPLLPQGLTLDPLMSTVQNAIRDGIIPILLSGYRFYRGGLRFKFLPTLTEYVTYTVQIRPDRRMVHAHATAGGMTPADSMYQHGYATSLQATSVNPIMTIEVPFYVPGNLGLLQRPSAQSLANSEVSRFYSLGELCLSVGGFVPGPMKELQFTVMYCVADDFSPYEWQGFPPMCFIKDAGLDTNTQ